MTTASSTKLIIEASGTLAPVISAAIGTPRPSVRMWRFTPLFARSVGFGPVRSPLLVPSPKRCRASSTSMRSRVGRRSSSAALDGSRRILRASPIAGTAGGTSSRIQTRSAAPSIGIPSSSGRGSPPSRHAQPREDVPLAVWPAPRGSAARYATTTARERRRTWLPRTAVDHTRSALSRGFRIGSKQRESSAARSASASGHCWTAALRLAQRGLAVHRPRGPRDRRGPS
jgi:hypothetical protein